MLVAYCLSLYQRKSQEEESRHQGESMERPHKEESQREI